MRARSSPVGPARFHGFLVRRVRPGDEEALCRFYNGLSPSSIRTFRPLGTRTTGEACAEIVRKNLPGDERSFDLVALLENRVAGWSFVWRLDSDEPTFGLGVADEYHGLGLGGALMDRVMEEARRRGLDRLFLTVVEDNQVARRMYEKRGFAAYDRKQGADGLTYLCMAAVLQRPEKG